MSNEQTTLYNLARGVSDVTLTPNAPPRRYPWANWQDKQAAETIYRDVRESLEKAINDGVREKAALQRSVVNESAEAFNQYAGLHTGVVEPTGITFDLLRTMAKRCEPVAAIHNTWIRYVTAFCRRPDVRQGYVKHAGLRIKMRIPTQKATDEDLVQMEHLTEFILNCGFVKPPKGERNANWKPGLIPFASQIIRDSLTIDGAFVRIWKSAIDPDGTPVVAFAAEDAAKIRKVIPETTGVKDGIVQTVPWKGERTNNKGEPIEHVKLGRDLNIEQEYTEREGRYYVRNPRTDDDVNGYGFSELESGLNAITIWLSAREYNASRFHKDSLPRGILSILGNLNEQQFQSFRLHWQQLLSGEGKRWFNPILKGSAQAGAAVNWLPIDMSSRDMEYHQFLFSVSLWLHSLYGISPEETGYEALSPFRPPLSEASPEAKLQSSQDKGFEPLLRWFEGILNDILWMLDPSRKYAVEFQGVGQGDEAADVEMFAAMLQSGQITPRMVFDMRDMPIPKKLEKDPCMDMLGTWAANHELMMQMDAQQQAQEQQQQAQLQGQQQQVQQQDQQGQQQQLAKMQAFHARNGQQEPGHDDGGMPATSNSGYGGNVHSQAEEVPDFRKPTAMQKALLDPWGDNQMRRPWFTPRSKERRIRVLFPAKRSKVSSTR